jgi:hypothetical protein
MCVCTCGSVTGGECRSDTCGPSSGVAWVRERKQSVYVDGMAAKREKICLTSGRSETCGLSLGLAWVREKKGVSLRRWDSREEREDMYDQRGDNVIRVRRGSLQ